MTEYLGEIATGLSYYIKGDIPSKKIDNAIKKWASGLDPNSIIGFWDTTVVGSGKAGYIFTDDKIYYQETMEKPKKLWYDDIKLLELRKTSKKDYTR